MALHVGVFGLGEAGAAIAGDLAAAGAVVRAYDPRGVPTPNGVTRCDRPSEAIAAAQLICALTAAADAAGALSQALDAMPDAVLYADFSTSAAGLKVRLADIAGRAGVAFADVALMAPVPGNGLRTPALVSGDGATGFAHLLRPLGMPIELAGERAGQAATRKLLRSVVIKGLAALVIESLHAAEAADLVEETWSNLAEQLTAADETFLRRIVEGTYLHALRRRHEMEATADLLTELGVEPLMTRGTVEALRRIEAGRPPPPLPR